MTASRLDILDRSVEKAHVWVNDLAEELGTDDRHHSYRVLRAYLHALRDQLSVDEAAQLAAQLPIFIRGVFYEGWDPSATPQHQRDVDRFLRRVAHEAMLSGETQASLAASAATRVLARHVSAGETKSVMHMLPQPLRELLSAPDQAISSPAAAADPPAEGDTVARPRTGKVQAARARAQDDARRLDEISQSLESAQKDLSAVGRHLGRGVRDLRRDAGHLLRDARRDLRKMRLAVQRDLDRLQKDLTSPKSASPSAGRPARRQATSH